VKYPWYITPKERAQIEQGDILFNFPIIEPSLKMPKRAKQIDATRVRYNLISHSCDIEDLTLDEIGLIQLLPVYGYAEFVEMTQMNKSKQGNLQNNTVTTHHMLEKCSTRHADIPNDHLVVDFMNLKIASIQEVRSFLYRRSGPPRIRLSHPYRENMSRRFSTIYSRVGLPQNIKKPTKIDICVTARVK